MTLKKYYLASLAPLLLFFVVLYLFKISFIQGTFFFLGYAWIFFLQTPGIEEKATSISYSYSFVKIAFSLNQLFEKFLNKNKKESVSVVLRPLGPLLFSVAVYFIFAQGNPEFCLLGSFVFEGVYFLSKRFCK